MGQEILGVLESGLVAEEARESQAKLRRERRPRGNRRIRTLPRADEEPVPVVRRIVEKAVPVVAKVCFDLLIQSDRRLEPPGLERRFV
jgi:hypothetical protein